MDFPKWYYDLLSSNCNALIGGCCGSGKSVLVNGLICRALCFQCGLVLIDPKRTELRPYARNNHCMRYADNTRDTVKALKDVINLMNLRFDNMIKRGLKTFPGYPVYIVIDELADLMITARKEVEPLLIKIATVGRAARIHIIACTQKVKSVIAPWLRANFDYRVGLRCTTPLESTGIIEQKGCESLPRFGHAIVRSPNYTELINVNIPYYSDQEIYNFIN